jgi:hypothetical protein
MTIIQPNQPTLVFSFSFHSPFKKNIQRVTTRKLKLKLSDPANPMVVTEGTEVEGTEGRKLKERKEVEKMKGGKLKEWKEGKGS